ncbi:MAG: DUF1501 domain-containing protein [Lysobacteraceae bacterium]
MDPMTLTRRGFLKTCAAGALVGAGGIRFAFGAPGPGSLDGDVLVVVYLRGGIDGLNLVVPLDGDDRGHYEAARPNLAIATAGAYGALPLTTAGGTASGFGLHPSASGLRDIWLEQDMAIVHACGLSTVVSRSHFDAQLYTELGTPGQTGTGEGWMSRAWQTDPTHSAESIMPALAVGSNTPNSLLGSSDALTMASPTDFALNRGAWSWQRIRPDSPAGLRGFNEVLADQWTGASALEQAGARAHLALTTVETLGYTATLPTGFPTSNFARQLWTIAQSIQFGMGLRYAAVDVGGWDTHDGQGSAGSGYHYYQNRIAEISQALAAFHEVLHASGHMGRVTVVLQSEFGRRVRENGNRGTDHGYGNPLLVIGGAVNGRRFFGDWPGLDPEVLSPTFGDIPVTTDSRRVLAEILQVRMGHAGTTSVFPGLPPAPALGIVHPGGAPVAPDVRMPGSAAGRVGRTAVQPTPSPADAPGGRSSLR